MTRKKKDKMSIFQKTKKKFDISNSDPEFERRRSQRQVQKDKIVKGGLNGDHLPEPVPNFISGNGDIVQKGLNNTWIVHTRDRPGSRASGHGGAGETESGAIDICVGRKGNSNDYVDPNFKTDAARIYISHKTDLDDNFELAEGSDETKSKSGIGLKADAIRIIGRESIKIVTGPFPLESSSDSSHQFSSRGIDLIAGNDDANLQAIPLGDNLSECLTIIVDVLADLSAMLDSLQSAQLDLEKTIKGHTHSLSIGNMGIPLSLSTDIPLLIHSSIKALKQTANVSMPMFDHRTNLENLKNNYLNSEGNTYICSTRNRVN